MIRNRAKRIRVPLAVKLCSPEPRASNQINAQHHLSAFHPHLTSRPLGDRFLWVLLHPNRGQGLACEPVPTLPDKVYKLWAWQPSTCLIKLGRGRLGFG